MIVETIYKIDEWFHRLFHHFFGSKLRPMMRNLIGKKDLIGVEIGVLYGDNALSLLNNLDIKKLYLIDTWKNYEGYTDNYGTESLNRIYEKVVKRFKNDNRIDIIRMSSDDAITFIPDELDFVYIDGNHQYEYVKKDIENYYPKIKNGGIFGGHDFDNSIYTEHDGVVKAAIEFSVKNNIKLFVGNPDFWMIKNN